MPSFTADGDLLHLDERGSGDPVIVLGGGPARHPDYLGDLGGLAARYRLVLPHLRGVGGTPMPADPARASWWAQAADVDALRSHLGLDRAVVLGHSAGTLIALAFAARFPDALARLVLVTPPAGALVDVPDDLPAIRSRRAGEPAYDAVGAAAQEGPPADADDERLTAWQQRIAPLSYARWSAPQQAHARTGGWSAAAGARYGALAAPDGLRERLAAVTAPVRVIAAAEDGLIGLAAPTALAGLFPDGRAITVAGAGHYPWVDAPEAFLAAAVEALEG